jgi:hypothetical protein
MFHSDVSFSQKEKAELFGRDAKAFITTYREAFDFVRYVMDNSGRNAF